MVEPDEEMLLHVLLDREKQHWEKCFYYNKKNLHFVYVKNAGWFHIHRAPGR
jgi:hypothetical protein